MTNESDVWPSVQIDEEGRQKIDEAACLMSQAADLLQAQSRRTRGETHDAFGDLVIKINYLIRAMLRLK